MSCIIWTKPSEKVSMNMRTKCTGSDSSNTCAKSHLGICSPLIHSIQSSGSVSGQWRPWSDCEDAQSDLGLRCLHMLEDMILHGTAYIMVLQVRCYTYPQYRNWIKTKLESCHFSCHSQKGVSIRFYINLYPKYYSNKWCLVKSGSALLAIQSALL